MICVMRDGTVGSIVADAEEDGGKEGLSVCRCDASEVCDDRLLHIKRDCKIAGC